MNVFRNINIKQFEKAQRRLAKFEELFLICITAAGYIYACVHFNIYKILTSAVYWCSFVAFIMCSIGWLLIFYKETNIKNYIKFILPSWGALSGGMILLTINDLSNVILIVMGVIFLINISFMVIHSIVSTKDWRNKNEK